MEGEPWGWVDGRPARGVDVVVFVRKTISGSWGSESGKALLNADGAIGGSTSRESAVLAYGSLRVWGNPFPVGDDPGVVGKVLKMSGDARVGFNHFPE